MPTTLTRSLLVVLIPGVIAIAPWILVLLQYTSATFGLDRYRGVAYALLFACAAVTGSMFEGLASFVEVRWDKERESTFAVHENWYVYLTRMLEPEPVGYRYLSRLATIFHFELSMLLAVPIFFFGSGLLAALRFRTYSYAIAAVSVVAVVGSFFYFKWQARTTHEVLCRTRSEINARTAG